MVVPTVWVKSGCVGSTQPFVTGGHPGSVVSDGTRVYWTDPPAMNVKSCPVSGCGGAPSVVGSVAPGPTAVAVDANAVYWVDSEGVRKIAK